MFACPAPVLLEYAATSLFSSLRWEASARWADTTEGPDAVAPPPADPAPPRPPAAPRAVADFDCRDEVDYDKIQLEVNSEYQQEFYDAHKDELEAWRDAAVAAEG